MAFKIFFEKKGVCFEKISRRQQKHRKLPSMQSFKCICTYVGVPLTKQMGLVAGHPDLAHGRTLLGVALAPSLSESTAAFLFPTGRPDFLK